MNITSLIKKYFKSEVNYFYYKKIVNNYYGMCGTDRNYCKVQKEKGRFACLLDMSCIQHMKNKGWILCEKIEYDNYLSRKGKS